MKGGIRTPLVDAPVDTLSGESAGGSIVCILFGFTKPLTAEQLARAVPLTRRLPPRSTAPRRSGRSPSGFVLADDRPDLMAMAQPDRIPA